MIENTVTPGKPKKPAGEKKPYTVIVEVNRQGHSVRQVVAVSPAQAAFFAKYEVKQDADWKNPSDDELFIIATFAGHHENLAE